MAGYESPNLQTFSRKLKRLMYHCGLQQTRLFLLIKQKMQDMAASEDISEQETEKARSGNSQANLCKIINGTVAPSRLIVYLMVESLDSWYKSDELKILWSQSCREAGYDASLPLLSQQDKDDLMYLAGYAPQKYLKDALHRLAEEETVPRIRMQNTEPLSLMEINRFICHKQEKG